MKRYGPRGEQPVTLKYQVFEAETDNAWLLIFDRSKGIQEWMPKGQCELDMDGLTVQAPTWLVEKKGLEGFAE